MIGNEINEPVFTLYAKNETEAKQKLYEKFHGDYDIRNKRFVLRGGFLGFFQREELEVTYVCKKRGAQNSLNTGIGTDYSVPATSSFIENKEKLLQKVGNPSGINNAQFNDLSKKLDALASLVEKGNNAASNEVHPTIQKLQEMLSENEFSYNYINKICERVKATFPIGQLDDFDLVQRTVVDWIGESINIAPDRVFRNPHVVIIVGPTGVGKTTTLVKLAAQYVMKARQENKKVELCFITTDTMRVGAFEQLNRYGEMFGLDVKKAEKVSDVQKIYEDVKDHVDAVFIDTSGYSPNDATHIGEMKSTLDVPGMNPDVYLAVTAGTKARDLQNIMQNYEPFGYKSVIITKCDESEQYGNVISVLWEKNKSVSYITNGQQAARCIEKANEVYFLIRLEGFKIDRIHIEDKFGVK